MTKEMRVEEKYIDQLLATGRLAVVVGISKGPNGSSSVTIDTGSKNPALPPHKQGATFLCPDPNLELERGDLVYKRVNNDGDVTGALLVAKYHQIPERYVDLQSICGIFNNWGAYTNNADTPDEVTPLLKQNKQ